MNASITQLSSDSKPATGWNIGFWIAQILLAVFYGWVGYMKLTAEPAALAQMGITWADEYPTLLRFIGAAELAGAVGLILPAVTRILPVLTPLAALGLTTIQVLAIGFHAMRGETAQSIGLNIALLALSLFILWGRMRKAPIAPR